ASHAFGTSFIVPSDREPVQAAKAIVIATGVSSHVVPGDNGMIYTIYELRVEEVIKGDIDASAALQLREPGGFLGDRGVGVGGAPRYAPGERALIFLDKENETWRTWSMVLGKFNFVRDLHGKQLLIRGADEGEIFGWDAIGTAHEEPYRDQNGFLAFVR